MKELRMMMRLDHRAFSVTLPIEENAPLEKYKEVLNAVSRAMLRTIKKKYFGFSEYDLIKDCLQKGKK